MPDIHTIGHSNHEIERFIELLQKYDVGSVVDVRSVAYSKRYPQFNREPLQYKLRESGIGYAHFSQSFGARRTEPEVMDEAGRVDFDRVRQLDAFERGIERLMGGIEQGHTIALMCAEADPLSCHRFGMVSVELAQRGLHVKHILPDGNVKDQDEVEDELLERYKKDIPQSNLFQPEVSRDEQLTAAYRALNSKIAWKEEQEVSQE